MSHYEAGDRTKLFILSSVLDRSCSIYIVDYPEVLDNLQNKTKRLLSEAAVPGASHITSYVPSPLPASWTGPHTFDSASYCSGKPMLELDEIVWFAMWKGN